MTLAGRAGQDVDPSAATDNVAAPDSPVARSAGSYRWSAALAAATALGLGAVAAVMLIAGHHPWDGPVVMVIAGSHGLHRGDILATGPALVSTALAWWCARHGRLSSPRNQQLEAGLRGIAEWESKNRALTADELAGGLARARRSLGSRRTVIRHER